MYLWLIWAALWHVASQFDLCWQYCLTMPLFDNAIHMSMWVSFLGLWFPLTVQKHSCRWIDYAKLPLGKKVCVLCPVMDRCHIQCKFFPYV